MDNSIQVVRAGGQLVQAWLYILNWNPQPQKFLEPREIQRTTLDLAQIPALVQWAKRATSPSRQAPNDDDDDDMPDYALPGPGR